MFLIERDFLLQLFRLSYMNDNELYIVKEYKFDNTLITEVDSIIDGCFKDCHKNFFHKFKYEYIYDIKLTKSTKNEIINLTIIVQSMSLYDLNKKSTIARQNGFVFNQINKQIIKSCSHQWYLNINYHLKFRIPMSYKQFFRVVSQNREFVQTFCNDMENPFHSGCQKWFSQLN